MGLRKQTGHAARMANRHLAALRRPCAKAQAQTASCRPGPDSAGPVTVPLGYCTSVAATGPPQRAPAQVCPAAACTREGPPSERREGLAAPTGQMNRRGWGMENWRAGLLELATPTLDRGGLGGQRGDWAPPTCQPACSLLRHLAGSHLPASRAPGPLVSASWEPIVLAGGHLGCRLLWGSLLGLAAPLLPTSQPLLLLLGRQ